MEGGTGEAAWTPWLCSPGWQRLLAALESGRSGWNVGSSAEPLCGLGQVTNPL